jgi:hypothetical protein
VIESAVRSTVFGDNVDSRFKPLHEKALSETVEKVDRGKAAVPGREEPRRR